MMRTWDIVTSKKHTIPTTTNKPVYLPHHTIPRQFQCEVCKCLDIWLHQGIIQPFKSPYASHVVIVHKKLREIYLCIDYHKLISITVRDAFPLPQTKPCRLSIAEIGLHHLTSFRGISNWAWRTTT